jgi:hypothetical protein
MRRRRSPVSAEHDGRLASDFFRGYDDAIVVMD